MTRQINLMQADLLPGHGPIQLPVFVLTLVVALLASAAYLGYHLQVAARLQADRQGWETRVSDSERQLHRLRQANPAVASEAELRRTNDQLSQTLQARQTELSGLASQLDAAASGFAAPLASLADYDLDGLWLTRIELTGSRSRLGLEGLARQPGLVPRYLAQLDGSAFSGLSIRDLDIRQADDSESLWRFSISDTPIAAGEDAP